MEVITELGQKMFPSLRIRNYRLYFIGQGFSHVGNWMQTVALGWLVLEVTASGTALGTMLAFPLAPLLLGAPFAGNLVDAMDKRQLLYVTQWISGILALGMSVLVFMDVVEVWMLYSAAVLFGIVDAIDRPLRQTFVHEMVGPAHLRNAVTLSSTEANVARSRPSFCRSAHRHGRYCVLFFCQRALVSCRRCLSFLHAPRGVPPGSRARRRSLRYTFRPAVCSINAHDTPYPHCHGGHRDPLVRISSQSSALGAADVCRWGC